MWASVCMQNSSSPTSLLPRYLYANHVKKKALWSRPVKFPRTHSILADILSGQTEHHHTLLTRPFHPTMYGLYTEA